MITDKEIYERNKMKTEKQIYDELKLECFMHKFSRIDAVAYCIGYYTKIDKRHLNAILQLYMEGLIEE